MEIPEIGVKKFDDVYIFGYYMCRQCGYQELDGNDPPCDTCMIESKDRLGIPYLEFKNFLDMDIIDIEFWKMYERDTGDIWDEEKDMYVPRS